VCVPYTRSAVRLMANQSGLIDNGPIEEWNCGGSCACAVWRNKVIDLIIERLFNIGSTSWARYISKKLSQPSYYSNSDVQTRVSHLVSPGDRKRPFPYLRPYSNAPANNTQESLICVGTLSSLTAALLLPFLFVI
jgi:hypothetical protein